jgi:hypothetical protein
MNLKLMDKAVSFLHALCPLLGNVTQDFELGEFFGTSQVTETSVLMESVATELKIVA